MASPPPLQAYLLIVAAVFLGGGCGAGASNFSHHFDLTWGGDRGKILEDGELLSLTLDKNSGSAVKSKRAYMFGKVDMQLKLIPGNSAGTVTTLYMASPGADRDEIDYEFLGNISGQPYTIHTNVYVGGIGDREQEFRPWFDPTEDFHTYSILWNPHHISFIVDGIPIRDFKNHEDKGALFPRTKPMKVMSSIWNSDDWATMGGLIKTDWSKAPFVALCRGFEVDGCISYPGGHTRCSSKNADSARMWQELDLESRKMLELVRDKYMIYDYCKDRGRFPLPAPECSMD